MNSLQQLIVSVILLFVTPIEAAIRTKCFSCATVNMKDNFLVKQRGPPNRITPPKAFDNNCNSDTWIIKDRSTDECDGFCFKWQQTLNNSGTYSYMTLRGCYSNMFNLNDPTTLRQPNHSFCTVGEVPLTCLSDSSVIEHSCWCYGDYCNSTAALSYFVIFVYLLLLS